MSDCSFVDLTCISPNCNRPRKYAVSKITPHHMAGNLTLEQIAAMEAKPSRQMSSNYAISSDGGIALLCHEADRSWCSSSPANDHRAITVEVANDQIGGQWHVSDAALEALVKLCVDICQRNPALKNGLNYTGDARGNLTKHSYFKNTACPGPYLGGKFSWLAEEVNKRLAGGVTVAGDALRAGMALHLERTNLYIASTSLAIAGVRTAPITCGAPRWSMAVCALPTAPAMWASTARSLAGLVWTMPRLVPGCVTRPPTAAA